MDRADPHGPLNRYCGQALTACPRVTKSHSRPHTSNDNPFSESHFKTLKYPPQFPKRFGCIAGRQGLLPPFLRLVQSGSPSRRSWPDDAQPGSLRPGRRHPRGAPENPRSGLSCQPRALRPKIANTARKTDRNLDKPARHVGKIQSLNGQAGCLIIVDTFRDALAAWDSYQATGVHVTADEADAWLARLEAGEDVEPPECHG